MEPVSNRRQQERFDIVGTMWGHLQVGEPARIRNVSATGALVESPHQNALDSTIALRVMVEGQPVTVDGRVRQSRPIETGPARGRYLIGVEFSCPPEPVIQAIEQLGAELLSPAQEHP